MTFPTDTWLLDRVEVLRGPASVLFGKAASAGRSTMSHASPSEVDGSPTSWCRGGLTTRFRPVPIRAARSRTGRPIKSVSSARRRMGTSIMGLQRLSLASSVLFDVTPDVTLRLAFDGQLNDPSRYWGTPLNDGSIDERLRETQLQRQEQRHLLRGRLAADWRITPSRYLLNETYALIADRHWRQPRL